MRHWWKEAVICFDFIKWQLLSIYLHQFQNIISPSVCIWSKHSINIMDPVQSGLNDVQITIAFTLQVNLSEAFVCFLCSSNEIDLCANCESIGSSGSGSRHTITRVLTSSSIENKANWWLCQRKHFSKSHHLCMILAAVAQKEKCFPKTDHQFLIFQMPFMWNEPVVLLL